MLKDLLEQKQCFKLICGAGNENLQEIERLVALYSKAGCNYFDFAASEAVLEAAQRGLDFSISKEEQKDYHFCVSIGTKNDQHVQKAFIKSERCKQCGVCVAICPQNAVIDAKMQTRKDAKFKINEKFCIGCLKCQKACKHSAIEIYSENKPIHLFTHSPIHLCCIELHVSDLQEAEQIWDDLCKNFGGALSICIGRKKFTDGEILTLLKKLVSKREPYTTIIQADGNPMSGGGDDFETTRPAVEAGKLIRSANLPIYLFLSGGTNCKTAELARLESLDITGVAMGSYARKIVKEYIEHPDFFSDRKIFNEALNIAENLVNDVKI